MFIYMIELYIPFNICKTSFIYHINYIKKIVLFFHFPYMSNIPQGIIQCDSCFTETGNFLNRDTQQAAYTDFVSD